MNNVDFLNSTYLFSENVNRFFKDTWTKNWCLTYNGIFVRFRIIILATFFARKQSWCHKGWKTAKILNRVHFYYTFLVGNTRFYDRCFVIIILNLGVSENKVVEKKFSQKISQNIFVPFNWKLLKIGSVSVRDIRKSVPILQVGGSTPAPPTLPVLRAVLLHKRAFCSMVSVP